MRKVISRIINDDLVFFTFLFGYILFVFRGAFSTHFFQDDYFFLKISRIGSVSDFLNFYSPFHEYSYKPLATETFYFMLHLLGTNVLLGHLIVFATYAIGLIYLYKVVRLVSGSSLFARISVFLYAISFIHVFQLYWFATFQEVALFTFLTVSFYSFLRGNYISFLLFFILAALCKETAALYTPFVILFTMLYHKGNMARIKKQALLVVVLLILTVFFWFVYSYSLNHVTSLDNYKIGWHPRVLLNNGIWHLLWGMGFPNFMPDYFSSFFSPPIPAFWEAIKGPYTKTYLGLLIGYWVILLGVMVGVFFRLKNTKKQFSVLVFCVVSFFMFLGPILFFSHKWMIRLTLPLIFMALLQGWILYQCISDKNKYIKYMGMFVLILYAVWNYYGVRVHEVTSTYALESSIYAKADRYFNDHRKTILNYEVVYFKDTTHNFPKGWNGSEKLKNSFSGDNFLDHFFPEKKMKVIYGFENQKIPSNAYILESNRLL